MRNQVVQFLLVLALCACAPGSVFDRRGDFLPPIHLPGAVPAPATGDLGTVAQSAFDQGEYGMALRYYQLLAEARPNDPNVLLGLAASADRAGHFEISAPVYDRLLAQTGPIFEYHNNIGFSYMLQGRYLDAATALDAALALRPHDPTALNNRALLERLKG